ncbi:hypothetical protein ABKV19_006739 [Rosa sericea]
MHSTLLVLMMLAFTNLWRCQILAGSTTKPSSFLVLRNYRKEPIPVTWEKPRIGWKKLNFDGSSKGKSGKATIGGVIRNHKAEFLLGFAESIGEANSTIAEVTALRRGLEFVLENEWSHVWLEGDAKAILDVIRKRKQMNKIRCKEVQRHVSHINSIIPKLDDCIISHVYREGNRAADKLAQLGHQQDEPRIWRYIPPDEVVAIVHEDAEGKIVIRRR